MYVVVSYDIPDDKRRTKVMKTLKNFGAHVQYSVFECDLEPKDFRRLRKRLHKLIKPEDDDVRFYFLCETCMRKIRRLGHGKGPVQTPNLIFIGGQPTNHPTN